MSSTSRLITLWTGCPARRPVATSGPHSLALLADSGGSGRSSCCFRQERGGAGTLSSPGFGESRAAILGRTRLCSHNLSHRDSVLLARCNTACRTHAFASYVPSFSSPFLEGDGSKVGFGRDLRLGSRSSRISLAELGASPTGYGAVAPSGV